MYQIVTSYMNTPLVLLDLFDTFCLSKKLLRFFLQLTFEARAPVVWGAGEGKHLSQPDVQKEGPLLFLSLESVCGPSAAPLQTAYLSLPGFCISTSHSGRSFQHAKGWSWLLAGISGVGGLAGCWLRLVHWQGHDGAVLPGLEGVLWSNHRKGTCRKLSV